MSPPGTVPLVTSTSNDILLPLCNASYLWTFGSHMTQQIISCCITCYSPTSLQIFHYPPTPLAEATWPLTSNTCFRKLSSSRFLLNIASQPLVPCSKSFRQQKGYHQSLPSDQTHPLPHLQHAGRCKAPELYPPELLLHLNRPGRSVPPYPNPPKVSEISLLISQQQPLLLPSLWKL